MKRSVLLLFVLAVPAHISAQAHHSPYGEYQNRGIKALSDDDVKAYLAGQGMGLALAAELNRYPGPLHVLEMAKQLYLTASQKAETEKARSAMLKKATELGKSIVERERELDGLFARGEIAEGRLRALVEEIARLQGELRITHLQAHLEMKRILTLEQHRIYGHLRGYDKEAEMEHEGH